MTYPGGKAGAGVYQTIINQLPPHSVYIEPFAGHGGVLLRKRPARSTIAIDADGDVAAFWRAYPWVQFEQGCGLTWLMAKGRDLPRDALVYCDPPYLLGVRRSQRAIYPCELGDLDHVVLLNLLRDLHCMVAISGYASDLYDGTLRDWRRLTFTAATRGAPAEEVLWCNFPPPVALHDYRYLGRDYRERERIKRKAGRWRAKFDQLPDLERQAVLSALELPPQEAAMAAARIPTSETAVSESRTADRGGKRSSTVLLFDDGRGRRRASSDLA